MGKVQHKAAEVEQSRVVAGLASAGHVVNGLVHILIGALAIGVALGLGGSADQQGAMRAIRSTPFGVIGLWVAAAALFALALYSIASGITSLRRKATEGLKELGRAVGYAAVGALALSYALGGSSDGDTAPRTLSARLLATGWGSVLLFAAAAVVLAIGVGLVVGGIRRSFLRDVDLRGMSRRVFTALGTVGYVAKGISIGAIGALLMVAVLRHNPDDAAGLDGSLKRLVELPFGPVLLVLIGVGLMLYGGFCFARARTVVRRAG